MKKSDADPAREDADGPLPEESASANGDDAAAENEEQDVGTVVRLSEAEKRRLRARGAITELWKQVMEPSMNTYNVGGEQIRIVASLR